MGRSSNTKYIAGSDSGPTLAELTDFVQTLVILGVDPQTPVSIERTPYYNQFDRGEWRVEITWPST